LKKAVALIPCRYESSRFPGKPLALLLGKSMIQRVYEGIRQAKLVDRVIIATDDEKILRTAEAFGAEATMTSPGHSTGTERVAEVARKLEVPLIINVQGDEPLVTGEMVDALVRSLQDERMPMASLMAKVHDLNLIDDPNIVKVAVDKQGTALYFSRAPLPYRASDFFYQHIGVYAFQRKFLLKFVKMGRSRFEEAEKLEQLRALENGYKIRMVEVAQATLSVDTPEDIIKVENYMKTRENG
jgi:3-deoxy-manno-octulosonate cytidylyltransferase (CMP-KDO synthetase)